MKASYRWIRRHAPVDSSPEELARTLTFQGLNVEEISHLAEAVPGDAIMGMIAGVDTRPDGLAVCTVDTGSERVTVVSRAPNVREGILVPYVPPGGKMGDGSPVSALEFGDVISEGILCSAAELGIPGGPSEYLLELADGRPGVSAVEALGLEDWTYDFDLTPNYATHCQSVLGIAREVDAAAGCGLRRPEPGLPREADGPVAEVTVEDPDLCPRYTAVVVEGLKVEPSPWWIQRDLLASGVRPINNVVDVTNYVMLETGQPLHAFDLDRLRDERIIVRRAREGENLVTLDGRERSLGEGDLVIADSGGAVGVAGVMGGENSEVHEGTSRILLESAHFDSRNVLKTSRKLALQTDASLRFEKGADPEATLFALERVVSILDAILSGVRFGPVADHYPEPREPRKLPLDVDAINGLLGTELTRARIVDYLERFGFEVPGDSSEVVVPSWRSDVAIPVDLAEEVARLHGYNEIPAELPRTEVFGYVPDKRTVAENTAVEYMVGAGFNEIVTRSWMPKEYLEIMGTPEDHPHRRLLPVTNPMRDEQSNLRSTLIPDVLKTLEVNRVDHEGVRVFELGRIYVPGELPPTSLPEEPLRMTLLAAGPTSSDHWLKSETMEADFYFLKGVIEGMLRALGVRAYEVETSDEYYLHPGRGARIVARGVELGHFGELHPDIADRADIEGVVVLCELDGEALAHCADDVPRVLPAPSFPSSGRDIALVVPDDVAHFRVAGCIEASAGELLEEVRLFDIYRGDPVPEGYKSMAYHLVYRAHDRTLTDEEVDECQEVVRRALVQDIGAELRS